MAGINSPLWQSVFGTVWDSLTDISPEIGGFLIDHVNRKTFMDDNALSLIGMRRVPGYDEMTVLLSSLAERAEVGSKITVKITAYNKDVTAGFFKVAGEDHKSSTFLPVCEISDLTLAMTRNSAPSILALIQIEETGKATPSEYHIFGALTAIIKESPKGTLISSSTRERYWIYIPDFHEDADEFMKKLRDAVKKSALTDDYGEPMLNACDLTFSAGLGADLPIPAQRMNTAEFSLYEAVSQGSGTIRTYNAERHEAQRTEYDKMKRFSRLVDENLFVYHFQPIVSARNGDIAAYEILMRSDSSIGMYPLEILECAEKTGRLYDIERATLRNALTAIGHNQEIFKDRKLFVNAIPAHMLTDEDWQSLENDFGELMEKMVIEFTEQTEVDDVSLGHIKARLDMNHIRVAIDDYGTGYSNTSNLLRYSPDYVKIDRILISGINNDPKMQKLVSGIIEFVHANGYLALAEGVETLEELRTMIQLGSDLIQGYYVSMPKPVMLMEVSDAVRDTIANINFEFRSDISKPYHASEGETVDLERIIRDHYTSVFVDSSEVTLTCSSGGTVTSAVTIKDGIKTRINLDGAHIVTDKEDPVIFLGKNCDVELHVDGVNDILSRGIYVPESSSLTITGEGHLHVLAEITECCGIGANKNQACGNITIDMTGGSLFVEANGESSVAIGGGKGGSGNTAIRLISANVKIHSSGGSCVGIGYIDGDGIIDIKDATMNIEISASNTVGIGCFGGSTDITMKNFSLKTNLSGASLCSVGAMNSGTCTIDLKDCSVDGEMRGKALVGIGSRDGKAECSISNSSISLYGEGSAALGIGDTTGESRITLRETVFDLRFLAGDAKTYGSSGDLLVRDKCNEKIKIND
ncbi:MAG: EAL domain-containing protein [Oscillospiraceae bacterium]|nr:EAL domain-containing protein [Oscillospiraceae bacterium]